MDVSPLLEACYAPTDRDEHWAADVRDGFREAFRCFDDVGMYVAECDTEADTITPTVVAAPPAWLQLIDAVRTASLRANQPLLYPSSVVNVMAEAERAVLPSVMEPWNSQRAAAGVQNGIAIVVHPVPACALVVFGNGGPDLTLDRTTRTALTRAALHIESGFRMRVQHGEVRAVIGADGKLVDGALTDSEHAQFASSTRGAEAARSTRDLGLWTALAAGHVSIVPRMRGSRRVYEIVENARAARRVRALTRRELDVLELASSGLSTKLCSYALGLSPATISTTLANAARKIGALSQLELLRIAALLSNDPRADADEATLTAAEREILALVRQGLSNAEIAAHRGRSVRTIANQVASLLEKTGRPSRRALIAS